jgi:hypothetical protein
MTGNRAWSIVTSLGGSFVESSCTDGPVGQDQGKCIAVTSLRRLNPGDNRVRHDGNFMRTRPTLQEQTQILLICLLELRLLRLGYVQWIGAIQCPLPNRTA